MNEEHLALARRISEALADLERAIARAEELRGKAMHTGDDGYWDGVALNLHGFYSGVEGILEDIAQVVDRKVPSGADWHRRLLTQMTEELPDTRPAVIATETFRCLDEYRGFRHVVRNVYAFNLRSAHLEELVVGLRSCHDAIKRDITAFVEFLKRLADLDDQADSH
ncbi:MAG: hypothetical protein AAB658_08045 [Chloroflexota bacterium]